MTLVTIDLGDVAGGHHPDDHVVIRAEAFRESPGGGVTSTAEVVIPLVDGVGQAEVEPGPVVVSFRCQAVADTREKRGVVPESGPVGIEDVIAGAFEYTPPVVNRGLDLIEGARDDALGQVSGAVDGAIGTRLDGKSNVGHKHESVDITDATSTISWPTPDAAGKLVKLNAQGKLYISTASITEPTEPANKKYVDDVETRATNALAGKAPTTHVHKSSQIEDATRVIGEASLAQRLLRTDDAGKIVVTTSSITEATDPANKKYVDDKTGPAATSSAISSATAEQAGKLVRLNEHGKLYIPTSAITEPTEPASKKYVDDVEVRTTSALSGKANLTHVHKSSQIDDATRHVGDPSLAQRLLRTDDAGKIAVSTSSITEPTDPANKKYVDDSITAVGDGAAVENATRAESAATQAALDRSKIDAARAHVDSQVSAIDTAFTESVPPYLQPGTLMDTYGPNAPSVTPYEWRVEQAKYVLWQDGNSLIAQNRLGGHQIYTSPDRGRTWVTHGALPAKCDHLTRITKTGTIIAVLTDGRVYRSVDDGATWTHQHTAEFNPLVPPVDTPSGNVVFGEYGGRPGYGFRVWTSVDDGVTWTASITSPPHTTDSRHWHSVCWDPYEECLVAQHDQQDFPHHYRSDDEGVTWQLIRAVSDTTLHPDWVQPLFFPNYIAWGYDNRRNGVISRMRREDYYSGNWSRETIEDVAQLNRKVFYGAMPVRPGMWLVAQSSETISRDPEVGAGAYSQEIHIVSHDGGRVSGGLEYVTPAGTVHQQDGHKFAFPQVPYHAVATGVQGDSWANIFYGWLPGSYAALPFSVGWNNGTRLLSPGAGVTSPHLRQGESLYAIDSEGTARAVLRSESSGELRVRGRVSGAIRELRLGSALRWVDDGVARMTLDQGGLNLEKSPLLFDGPTKPAIRVGEGTPAHVLTGARGSLYIDSVTGQWWRQSGATSATWTLMDAACTSAQLAAKADLINESGKYPGRTAFDTTLNRPVWATGPINTDPWVDATGTEVHTPQ